MFPQALKYRSISIAGTAKNAGKTECLNYILGQVKDSGKRLAVTSIGLDGESTDQVTGTAKPEIEIYEGMVFITSEKHYRQKRLVAEILDVSPIRTSLGRLVVAKAVGSGRAILSGPADMASLKTILEEVKAMGVDTLFVDGALSRRSLASPAVTEAMILATGAATARSIPELVRKTCYTCELINLEEEAEDDGASAGEHKLVVPGIVGDSLLNRLSAAKEIKETVVVVKDFTRVFATPEAYYTYLRKGGRMQVQHKAKLLGICINPVSPEGYVLNSDELRDALAEKLHLPVFDVRRMEHCKE